VWFKRLFRTVVGCFEPLLVASNCCCLLWLLIANTVGYVLDINFEKRVVLLYPVAWEAVEARDFLNGV
jgi:hypothetical protein